MADEIVIETTSTEVVEVGVPGPQGPAGAAGAGLTTLTTAGDLLYRDNTEPNRLPIGSNGQVLKVSGGLPAWANESGAVTSVNGAIGAVTVAAEQHASEHEAGEADEIQAMAALVDTDYLPLNGVYFHDGTLTSGRPNFFKTGTRKNTKLQWNNSTSEWELIRNLTLEAVGWGGTTTFPWTVNNWADGREPAVVETIAVTRLGLEDMTQKLAETGSAATATTSQDGLISAADQQKLNGIAAGAEVNVQANWTEADSTSDAFIQNKPSTFAPSAHAASHASAGSDPLAPSDIGAQSIFSVESLVITTTAQVTLTAARAKIYDIVQYAGAAVDVKLPSTNAIQGDVVVLRWGTGSNSVNVVQSNTPAVIATVSSGEQKRFIRESTDSWTLIPVDTHTHTPSQVGLGNVSNVAQVTSVSGTAPIVSSGGTTPVISVTTGSTANTVCAGDDARLSNARTPTAHTHPAADISDSTTAGRALLMAADAAAQRTALSLAASATTDTTNANNISNGTLAPARMGSGTPSASNYLRGDGSWQAVTAGVGGSTGATDNVILRSDGTGGATLQDSAFIIADNATASPNNTVNHASIQATGGTTNVSVSIVPKGTGAFMLQVPNAANSGGNARGANAVDLQRDRTAPSQVASGDYSFLGGSFYASASGIYSAVCGGREGVASGYYSAIVGGWGQEATSEGSFSGGGDSNRASGLFSSVLGGSCALADRRGIQAHASGMFGSTKGSAQRIRAVLRNRTTNATATELFLEGSSTRFTIPSGKVISALINIVGVKSDGLAVAQYVREVCAKNVAGTSSMVGTVTTIGTDQEDNASADVSITVSDANDAIQISVTGIASETWRWVASVDAVEVAYGT